MGNESAGLSIYLLAASPSPYDGVHPYVLMIVAIYYAWAILMIRGAKDPRANAALFDFEMCIRDRRVCTSGTSGSRRDNRATRRYADMLLGGKEIVRGMVSQGPGETRPLCCRSNTGVCDVLSRPRRAG